jgi:hypothetical protein
MAFLDELRAQLLCKGASPTEAARDVMLNDGLRPGFIHGVVLRLPTGMTVNTSVLDAGQWKLGDPTLRVLGPALVIEWQNELVPVTVLPAGRSLVTSSNLESSLDMFSLHNDSTLFCSPVDQCIFGVVGKPCTFCTYEMEGPIRRLPVETFSASLDTILRERTAIRNLAIGGATPNLHDSGAAYYSELVKKANDRGLLTSVELVPPPRLQSLSLLFDAGMVSLIMSLEIWDDAIRHRVCLGKGEVTVDHYRAAWRTAIDELGRGQVASVLLVGLEPLESTAEGAESLIAEGVIPTLIPYRPYDRIAGLPTTHPFSVVDYLELSQNVRHLLAKADLDPAAQAGCTGCGGCSLEIPTDMSASPNLMLRDPK